MNEQQLWNRFCKSGKIEHYLEYAGSRNKIIGGSDGTDKNKGSDTEGSQS